MSKETTPICNVCEKPLMTIDGKERGEHWWHSDPTIIKSEDGHIHDFSHIKENSIGHCKLCSVSISPLQISNTERNDKEYFENESNLTIEYISERLLNMHPDYHFKYLDHIRKSTHKLMEMYKESWKD